MWSFARRAVNAVFSVFNGQGPLRDRYVAKTAMFLLAMLYLALSNLPNRNPAGHFTVCLFHNITGWPCPACGTVRGLKYFFHLQLWDSIMMNPLAALVALYMIVGVVWMLVDLWRGTSSYEAVCRFRPRPWMLVLIVALTIANWWWNFQKGL